MPGSDVFLECDYEVVFYSYTFLIRYAEYCTTQCIAGILCGTPKNAHDISCFGDTKPHGIPYFQYIPYHIYIMFYCVLQ